MSPKGSDSNAGTQVAPVLTVGHAMDLAKAASKRVYACGNNGSYNESLVVGASRDGVNLYGGLDCTTTPAQWAYNASDKATMAPAAKGYALQVTGLSTGVTFEDFGFVAQPGSVAGDSSIAVFVASSSGLVLRRSVVTAGTAQPGQDQSQPAPYASSAPAGNPGAASKSTGGTGAGGPAATNAACNTSIGGAGGSAVAGQLDGQPGEPGGVANNNAGTQSACLSTGAAGGGGLGGSFGSSGVGAAAWASFTAAGWTPAVGQAGASGSAAQGGGGGGTIAAGVTVGGGGGGGAGGCGGAGGPAGTGGGSSMAVLLFDSTVTLDTCVVSSAGAGRGGNGAAGQVGQLGGGGGAGGTAACAGGHGGQGGQGGPGGGGAGGLSAGVVWLGTPPTITAGSQTPGALGAAGQNGDGTVTARAGTAGGVVQFQ